VGTSKASWSKQTEASWSKKRQAKVNCLQAKTTFSTQEKGQPVKTSWEARFSRYPDKEYFKTV
jgi:hypothetical protein